MQTRYHDHPTGALVDKLGELVDCRRAFEHEERLITDEIRRRNVSRAAGEHYVLWIERDVAWLLDAASLRQAIGEEEYTRHCRAHGRTSVRVQENGNNHE